RGGAGRAFRAAGWRIDGIWSGYFAVINPVFSKRGITMRSNKLRELLKAGKPTLGTHLHSSWPAVVEAVGHSGRFDYVEFVAEYAPFELYALDDFCRAAELHDLSSMIKVDQEPRAFLAQRGIGAGFQSV